MKKFKDFRIDEILNFQDNHSLESIETIKNRIFSIISQNPEEFKKTGFDLSNFLVIALIQLEKEKALTKTILYRSIVWLKHVYDYGTPDNWFLIDSDNSFNCWFLKRLKPNILDRCINNAKSGYIVSPAEAMLLSSGFVNNTEKIFIKNTYQPISSIISEFKLDLKNPVYINFKLLRIFYHRLHSPIDGVLEEVRTFDLYSTKFFNENFGQILKIKHEEFGHIYMFIIGEVTVQDFNLIIKEGQTIKKCQEIGNFKNGSQTILVMEKDFPGISNIQVNKKYFVGDPLILK